MATEVKNGQVAADAMADAASKVTQEAKVVTDTLFEVSNKVAKEAQAVLDTQQKLLQDNFNVWQKYNQTYLDFVIGTTQQTFEDSLALRERLVNGVNGNWKKAQESQVAEQTSALEATEAFWAQAQAASERVFELFTPVSFK